MGIDRAFLRRIDDCPAPNTLWGSGISVSTDHRTSCRCVSRVSTPHPPILPPAFPTSTTPMAIGRLGYSYAGIAKTLLWFARRSGHRARDGDFRRQGNKADALWGKARAIRFRFHCESGHSFCRLHTTLMINLTMCPDPTSLRLTRARARQRC